MIFSNHSCDPNLAVQGQIVFVALRDIAAGEELTHDWKKTELQVKYAGRFSWYLQKKIEAATWGKSI